MSTTDNREAVFMGKVTAAATHEIRNVLAIVQESSGLIEDMVNFFQESGKLKPDRLLRSVERIALQVDRGAELMTALNRVAHGLDCEKDRVDLHQEASHVALLSGRLAKQKGHKLEVQQSDRDVFVTANRLHLEMALFSGLECCIEQLPEAGTVVMNSGRVGNVAAIDFVLETGGSADLAAPSDATEWNRVLECLELLGATVDTASSSSHFRFNFPPDVER